MTEATNEQPVDSQIIQASDAADANEVFSGRSVYLPGAVEATEPPPKWSAIDNLTNVRDTLKRTREWALSKVAGVEDRLAEHGGEPTAEAKALIGEILVLAGSERVDA